MSHDTQNPISNETGEYLQELVERVNISKAEAPVDEPVEDKPEPKPRKTRAKN